MNVHKRRRWMDAAILEARARCKLVLQDYSAFESSASVDMVTEARKFLAATADIKTRKRSNING